MFIFSGQTFTQASKVMAGMGIEICSESTFYHYQRSLVIPAIQQEYDATLSNAKEVVANQGWWLIHEKLYTTMNGTIEHLPLL